MLVHYETVRRWILLILGSVLAVYLVLQPNPNPYSLAFVASMLGLASLISFFNGKKNG